MLKRQGTPGAVGECCKEAFTSRQSRCAYHQICVRTPNSLLFTD
jgi:hypothetical protein